MITLLLISIALMVAFATLPRFADEGGAPDSPGAPPSSAEPPPPPPPDGDDYGWIDDAIGPVAPHENQETTPAGGAAQTAQDTPADETARIAAMVGFPAEQLGRDQTENQRKLVEHIDRLLASAAPASAQTPASPAATAEPRPEGFIPFEKYQFKKIKPEEYDPDVVEELNSLNDHYAKHMQSIIDAVALAMQNSVRAANLNIGTAMDALFDTLPEEYRETFGKGPAVLFGPDDPALAMRHKVVAEMANRAAAFPDEARLPLREQFNRAVNTVLGPEVNRLARRAVQKEMDKRNGVMLARPVQGAGPPPRSGRQEAEAFVRQFLSQRRPALDPFAED